MANPIVSAQLADFFLFSGLSADELSAMDRELAEPVCYPKGALIYDAHAFRHSLGLILSGTVLVRSHEETRNPVVMNRLHSGEIFGAAALFEEVETDYVTQLVAQEPVTVRFITQEQMSSLFLRFPQTAQNYIRFLSGRIRFLNRKLSTLTGGSAVSRLYRYCLSHQDEDGTVPFPKSMTELSRVLNMGRSSLYRALDTLSAEGILVRNGKQYRLI